MSEKYFVIFVYHTGLGLEAGRKLSYQSHESLAT